MAETNTHRSLEENFEFLFYFTEGVEKLKQAVQGLFSPMMNSVNLVEAFNRQMLQAQIAYTIATEQTDAFGNAITNFGNRMEAVQEQFKQLALDIEKSTQNIVGLTSSRLNNVMNEIIQETSSILPQYTSKVGTDPLEVIKKLTENLSATFSLLGSPEFQDPQEVRALMWGNVNDPNAFVAQKLNISTSEAQEAQAQGRYIDLLLERTQAYREASTLASGSLTNVLSNFQELQEQIQRGFGEPLMKELTKSAGELFNYLNSTKSNSKTDITLSTNKAIVAFEKDRERLIKKRELSITDVERGEIDKELKSIEENIKQTIINANAKLTSLGIDGDVQLFQGSLSEKEQQIEEYGKSNPLEDTPVQKLIELARSLGDSFTNIISSISEFGASIANLFKSLGGLGALKGLFVGLRTVVDGVSGAIKFVTEIINTVSKSLSPLEPILSPIFAVLGSGVGAVFTLISSFVALNTATGLVIASFREMGTKIKAFYDNFAMYKNRGAGNPTHNIAREVVHMNAYRDVNSSAIVLANRGGFDEANRGIFQIGNTLRNIDFVGLALDITFFAGALKGLYEELPSIIERLKKVAEEDNGGKKSDIYSGLSSILMRFDDFWFNSGIIGIDRDKNPSISKDIRDQSKLVTDGIFRRIGMLYDDPNLTIREKFEKAQSEGGEKAQQANRQLEFLVKEYRLTQASIDNAGKSKEEIMNITDPNLTESDKEEIAVRAKGLGESETQKKLEEQRAEDLAKQIKDMTGVDVKGKIMPIGGKIKGDFGNEKITAMEGGFDVFTDVEKTLDVGVDIERKFNNFIESTNTVMDQEMLGAPQLSSVADKLLEVFKNDALSSDLRMKAVESYKKAIQKELEIVNKLAEASQAFSDARMEAGEISKEQNDYEKALARKMKADAELEKGLKEQTLKREINSEQKKIEQQEIAKLQQQVNEAPKTYNELNDQIQEQREILKAIDYYRKEAKAGAIDLGNNYDNIMGSIKNLDPTMVKSIVDADKVKSVAGLARSAEIWVTKGSISKPEILKPLITEAMGTPGDYKKSMEKLRSILIENDSVRQFIESNPEGGLEKDFSQFIEGKREMDTNMLTFLMKNINEGKIRLGLDDVTKDSVRGEGADIIANQKISELEKTSGNLLKDINIDVINPEQQAIVDDIINKLKNVEVGSEEFKKLKDQELNIKLSEENLENIRKKIKDLESENPESKEIPILQAQEKALLDRRNVIAERNSAQQLLDKITPELESLNKKLMTGSITPEEEKRREELDNIRRENEEKIEEANKVLYEDTNTQIRQKQENSAKAEKEREELVKSQIMMLTQEAITQAKLLKLAEARLKRAQEIADAEAAILEASKALAEVQLKSAKSFDPELFQGDVAKANLKLAIEEEEQAKLDADIAKDLVGVRKSTETTEAINVLKKNEENLTDEDIKTELERRFSIKFTTANEAKEFLNKSSLRSTGIADLLREGKTDDKNLSELKKVLGDDFNFKDKDLLADVASSAIIGSDRGVKLATIGNQIRNTDTLTEEQKKALEELGISQDKLNSKVSAERAIRQEIAKITGSNEVTVALNEQTAAEEKALLATRKRIEASKELLNALASVAVEEQKRITRESGIRDIAKSMGIGVESPLSDEDLNLNDSIRQYQDAMIELNEFRKSRTKEQIEKIEGLTPEEVKELMSGGNVAGFSAEEAEKFRNALESAKKAMDAIEKKANSVFEKATNQVKLLAELGSIGVGPMNNMSKAQRDLVVSQTEYISALNKVKIFDAVKKDATLTNPIGLGDGRGFDPLSTERIELIKEAARKAQEYILNFAESIKDSIRQNIEEINSLISSLDGINSALSISDKGISALSAQAEAIMGDLDPQELEGKSIYEADEFERREWINPRTREEEKISSLKEMQAQFEKEQAALAAKRQEIEAKITAMKLKSAEMELRAERIDIIADPNLSKKQKALKLASNSMRVEANIAEQAMWKEVIPQLTLASQVADARAKGMTNRDTAGALMSINLQNVADARARYNALDNLVTDKAQIVDSITYDSSGEINLMGLMDSVGGQFGELFSEDQFYKLQTDSAKDLNSNVSKILDQVTKIANGVSPESKARIAQFNVNRGVEKTFSLGITQGEINYVMKQKGIKNEIQSIPNIQPPVERRVFINKLSKLDPYRYEKWLGEDTVLKNPNLPVVPLTKPPRNYLPTVSEISSEAENVFRRRSAPPSLDSMFGRSTTKSGSSVVTIEDRSIDIIRNIDKNVEEIKSKQSNNTPYTINIPIPGDDKREQPTPKTEPSINNQTNTVSEENNSNVNNLINNQKVENITNVQNIIRDPQSTSINTIDNTRVESLLGNILGTLQSIGSSISGLSKGFERREFITPKIEVTVGNGGVNPPIPTTPVIRNTGLMPDESLKIVERFQLMRK